MKVTIRSHMPSGTIMKSDLQRILTCDHHDPFCYLGAHFDVPQTGMVTLRTFQPHAREVKLLLSEVAIDMTKCDRRDVRVGSRH